MAPEERREVEEGTAGQGLLMSATPLPLDEGISGYLSLNGRTISGNPAPAASAGASTLSPSSGFWDWGWGWDWQKGRSSAKLPVRSSTASSSLKGFTFLLLHRMQNMASVAAARMKSPEAMPATRAVGKGCPSLVPTLTTAVDE